MSKFLIAIFGTALIATLYSLAVGQNTLQLSNIPIFYFAVLIIFSIQIIAFIPANILKTQVFYDVTGSLTFIIATLFCLCNSVNLSNKQILAAGMVILWTTRLGGFLLYRILRKKQDSRFKKIKENSYRFFMVWFIQGLWVTVTAGDVFVFLTSKEPNKNNGIISIREYVGLGIWLIGFIAQSMADFQKLLFNSNPQNKDKFISTGLWEYSRHPNYCGEIAMWTGVAIFVSNSLQGWQKLSLISPIFVYILLSKVSGIPMLEAKANKKWGKTFQYEQYKKTTPILFPWMPVTEYKPSQRHQKQA